MSLSKEENLSPSSTGEGGENSDQSLSDSWTVLDSSHFKEDGDLSDAESVEVLHEDHTAEDHASSVVIGDDGASETSTTTALDCDESSPTPGTKTEELEAGSPSDDGEFGIGEKDDDPAPDPPRKARSKRPKKKYVFQGVPIEVVGEPFSNWLLQIAIYSLFVDMVLLCYFGLSSLTGLLEIPTSQYLKPLKPYQAYEMEPLSLQFSHVLAEWKKHPLQDHSLDRLVLKTLLLHYGGSSELSANLQALTEKVQKHNDLIKRLGREHDWKELQHHRMVTSAHIAHAVACILGKQDNERAVPAELFMNHTKDDVGEFAPEPGFWLNDWHLPQYFRANDTFYRVDSKPDFSPTHKLYLHLGSSKWNEYFWKLRMGNEKVNEGEKESRTAEKSSESDLEGEETQRSPLDLSSSVDFISEEESSGNLIELAEELPEDGDPFIFREIEDPDHSVENLFKLLRADEHADAEYISRYPGSNSGKATELKKKDQLNEWYEGVTLEEQENDQPETGYHGFAEDPSGTGEAFDGWYMVNAKTDKLSKENQENMLGIERPGDEKNRKDKVRQFIDEISADDFNYDDFGKKFNEYFPEKKLKSKVAKRKYKSTKQYDNEISNGKLKQKKKPKGRTGLDSGDTEDKKKLKKRDSKKDLKFSDKFLQGSNNRKKRFADLRGTDWNSRMAEGREKLRALNGKGDDQIWLFERAKARRDMREEIFTE